MNPRWFLTVAWAGLAATVAAAPRESPKTTWTVMIYGGVDSTAESYLMPHLADLKAASPWGVNGDIVLLIDRVKGASDDRRTLGENFDDTRLYHLGAGRWDRIGGGDEFPEITADSTHEANTGDARTLRKFIRSAKQAYPADRYALILFGHGESRSVCPDVSSPSADSGEFEDAMFTAEITEALTAGEAVDVLWVDTCSFGSIENAYEFRPADARFHARVLLASPSLSFPAPMLPVLRECGIIRSTTDLPVASNALAFGRAAMKAIAEVLPQREAKKTRVEREAWACYDLAQADAVKQSVDALAVALADGEHREILGDIRGWGDRRVTLDYLYFRDPLRWVSSAHFDLYDLARRIRDDARLSESVREAAAAIVREVDAMVIDSVGTDREGQFVPGRHGLYIVFPGGIPAIADAPVWSFFRWYHPFDQRTLQTAFGNYAWCRDGASPGNHRVENWFELLDSWLDVNDGAGGFNHYQW